MKILLVGSNSIHVSSFIQAIDVKQHEVILLSEEICHFQGVKKQCLVDFRNLNPLSIVRNYKKLKEIIRTINAEVIHIHQVNRLAYFVAKIASELGIHVVTTAWGSDVLLMPKKNKFFYFLVKKTLQRSTYITADAQIMIDEMRKIAPSTTKYSLLQYGIDKVTSVEKEKIIYSNRLHKKIYRIDQIITYFNEFQKVNPDWRLIVASSGIETENLRSLASSFNLKNHIEFVGWLNQEENNKWYSKAMIYISIPESDGTSASLLEAMSAGCIPIIPDLPVSYEWVENGVNGVIESKNANPLFEVLKLDRKKVVEINANLVDTKASRKASMTAFFNLYTRK